MVDAGRYVPFAIQYSVFAGLADTAASIVRNAWAHDVPFPPGLLASM
jgi:hypothetical protein